MKTLVREQDGYWRTTFESVSELIEFSKSSQCVDRGSTFTYNQIVDMATNKSWGNYVSHQKIHGWMQSRPRHILDAVEQIKRQIEDKVALPTKARRKRHARLDIGDELDSVAWVQRNPEGWSDTLKVRVPKNNIRIGVNLATNCGCGPRELLYRGAALLALADLLIQEGNNVEIVAFETGTMCSKNNEPFTMNLIVKPMSAPLDMAAACIACAEIGFYRLVVLPSSARLCPSTMGSGCTWVRELPPADAKSVDVLVEARCQDEESAVKFVLKQLAKFAEHKQ